MGGDGLIGMGGSQAIDVTEPAKEVLNPAAVLGGQARCAPAVRGPACFKAFPMGLSDGEGPHGRLMGELLALGPHVGLSLQQVFVIGEHAWLSLQAVYKNVGRTKLGAAMQFAVETRLWVTGVLMPANPLARRACQGGRAAVRACGRARH